MKYILDNIGLILSVLGIGGGGGLVGLWIGKRKRAGEATQVEANALITMQQAYAKFTDDSNNRFATMQKELDAIKLENIEQRKDIRLLIKDNRSLHNQVTALSNENSQLRASIKELQNENQRLKDETTN